MNSLLWNYLRTVSLVFIQGILVTILLHPCIQLAAIAWGFNLFMAIIWVFMTSVGSMGLAKTVSGQGKKGLPFLALGFLAPLGLALLWKLPLVLCFPLILILLYSGARFMDYPRRKSFALDWAWGCLLLVLTATFAGYFGYELGLASMMLFFALGMLALIIWNATALAEEGLTPDYGGLGRTVALFVLVVGGLALVLGMLLSPSFLQMTLALLGRVYGVFMDGVVFFIVRPFAWLLSPLFRWAENVEKHQVPMELPEIERVPLERSAVEEGLDPTTVQALGWGGWVFLVAVLFVLVWLVVRKLLGRQQQATTKPVKEMRESVFSGAEVLQDLQGALRTLVRPLARLRSPKWYRGEDPVLIIRTFYARFAVKAHKDVPCQGGMTPLEYSRKLLVEQEGVNVEALQTLTMYYNEARYGEQGDGEAVMCTEKAFRQL